MKNPETATITPTFVTQSATVALDQNQLVSYGIAKKESLLDAAVSSMEHELKPLIRRHQELQEEIDKALPKAAETAGSKYEPAIRQAFAALGVTMKFAVTGARVDEATKKGMATLEAKKTDGYSCISGVITFELPDYILDSRRAIHALSDQIAMGRQYQVELKRQLANLEREERSMRGAIAEQVFRQSEEGRVLIAAMESGMLPLPPKPDLLALGDGRPTTKTAAKKSSRR